MALSITDSLENGTGQGMKTTLSACRKRNFNSCERDFLTRPIDSPCSRCNLTPSWPWSSLRPPKKRPWQSRCRSKAPEHYWNWPMQRGFSNLRGPIGGPKFDMTHLMCCSLIFGGKKAIIPKWDLFDQATNVWLWACSFAPAFDTTLEED